MFKTWGTKFSKAARKINDGNILQKFTELMAHFTSWNERLLKILISRVLGDSHDFTILLLEYSEHKTVKKTIEKILKQAQILKLCM